MKLSKFSEENLIQFKLSASSKDEVIKELVDTIATSNMVKDADLLLNDVLERENLVTTGVGYGVAFPHAKTRAVKGIVIAFGRSVKGIEFDAMDHQPVKLFFLNCCTGRCHRGSSQCHGSPVISDEIGREPGKTVKRRLSG